MLTGCRVRLDDWSSDDDDEEEKTKLSLPIIQSSYIHLIVELCRREPRRRGPRRDACCAAADIVDGFAFALLVLRSVDLDAVSGQASLEFDAILPRNRV